MPIDSYGRKIDYIRVSITDLCNLSCIYCKQFVKKSHFDILRFEEIIKILEAGTSLGIENIRITGGEPLVKEGFSEFVSSLSKLPVKSLSITTNGVFLNKHIYLLKSSGFSCINVSLDSLKREKYKEITGFDEIKRVISGIKAAKEAGFIVKINMVIMKGINDDELFDFIRFSRKEGIVVRFIELMPVGDVSWKRLFVSLDGLFNGKKELGEKFGVGPARYYEIEGGIIGIISAMSKPFCNNCNKIRLIPDGRIRPCLGDNKEIDIKTPIREGASLEEIKWFIKDAIQKKPFSYKFKKGGREMSAIGG